MSAEQRGVTEKEAPEPVASGASASPHVPEADDVRASERWAAFSPAPELAPSRAKVAAVRVGRFVSHEWTLACLGAVLLAIAMTWPAIWYVRDTIPQDIWDPTLQAWEMAWSGHILTTDPAQLWHANAFFPDRYSFAFTDSLLGYAPAGMIGSGPAAAVVRYNVMFVLLHALAFVGAYALVRQLGAGRAGAAAAAAAYAYAPWRLAQSGHMHVLSTGGIALALAMLARGHGWSLRRGYRPERRKPGWALAGWLVAAWQITIGFGIGLPFGYFLGAGVLVVGVMAIARRLSARPSRPPFGVRLLLADLVGIVVFGATSVLMAIPYFEVIARHPYAKRSVEELRLYSSPLRGFFTAPAESRIWGHLHEEARASLHPETSLLPGFVLIALAVAGLFFSIWTVRQRLFLAAGVAVTVALAMGTEFGDDGRIGYLTLYEYLPGWDAIRTPGRLVLWTTLLLGILAAGTVCAFVERTKELSAERVPARPGVWLRLAAVVPLLLVLIEGLNTTPHPVVPAQPEAMRVAAGPLLVLPSDVGTDNNVMLWSTDRFERIVNGNSGFTPRRLAEIRIAAMTFPDQESVAYLREQRVATVIVLHDRVDQATWQAALDAPLEALGITREDVDGDLVFHLSP